MVGTKIRKFDRIKGNVEHFWRRLAGIILNWPGNYQIVLSHYGLLEQFGRILSDLQNSRFIPVIHLCYVFFT